MLSAQLLEENLEPILFKPDEALQPLPKEITDEIRNILEECRDGQRLHNQVYFATKTSCGTARCIAGWKVFDDFKGKVRYTLFQGNFFDLFVDDDCASTRFDEWKYAQTAWKLTYRESDRLFNSSATFEEQFDLLEQL